MPRVITAKQGGAGMAIGAQWKYGEEGMATGAKGGMERYDGSFV